MEFLRERVYTALNADELRAGDKVIVADDIFSLRAWAESGSNAVTSYLLRVQDDEHPYRFQIEDGTAHLLAYLVERKENCTNCGNRGNSYCSCFTRDKSDDELSRTVCGNYIRLSEQKEMCLNCKHYNKRNDFRDCTLINNPTGACPHYEAEKHYRPFKDTDELIKVWCEYKCPAHNHRERGLTLPFIWIRRKNDPKDKGRLITAFNDDCVEIGEAGSGDVLEMGGLFEIFEFLDGSPCGVEE